MSDLGLLSHQYQALANLARQLKQWAVRVKCAHYNLPVPEDIAAFDVPTAVNELARIMSFLKDVVGLKNEGEWPEHWLTEPALPSVLVEQLHNAHTHEMPLYIQRLEQLSEHLGKGAEALTDKDMTLLDSIVLAADADANAVFRRLMRWR